MNPDNQPQLEGTKLSGFEPVNSVTKLESLDTVEGTGDEVQEGATITAHYTGALCSDGTIFQSSHDMGRPITFPLGGVIKGWQQGVPGMKVGGTRRLIIPAEMAYGSQSPAPNIPANSDLVFDIELVAIA
jgi:FKBP-type peptidyl-prolyl cis-trans isomerase